MTEEIITADVCVIGSGPGGALSAALLAESGRDVLLVEEGRLFIEQQIPSFSMQELDLKYRHKGLSPALGGTAYLEGCCVGGASEVNAGLYHRPFDEIIDGWSKNYKLESCDAKSLAPYFQMNEKELSIGPMPAVGLASQLIQQGSQQLGWKAIEIPRMWKYTAPSNKTTGSRQSMAQTFIPRFMAASGRLCTQTKITRLNHVGGTIESASGHHLTPYGQKPVTIKARQWVIAGGAIQTPFLLRKSGITKNIGNTLRIHPAIRVVAHFKEQINDPSEGVPVYQVAQFKPHLTLGGSYSGLPHLGLWLAGRRPLKEVVEHWQRMSIFYALTVGTGLGRVRVFPWGEPMVSLAVTKEDYRQLAQGIERLAQLLFTAGAESIDSPVKGDGIWYDSSAARRWEKGFPKGRLDLSTIHLFCSCPMGEAENCPVDSWGKLKGFKNVLINDASILPDSPAANPQATIMALARRNIIKWMAK